MTRFAFYGRVSTEDMQDPEASRSWQLQRSRQLVEPAGGEIITEYFDIGQSRSLPWSRRPAATKLLQALADPNRGFEAVVVGEPARAFHGNQFSLTFPLFVHYEVELWVPEVGGQVDPDSDAHDLIMGIYGGMSKGERNRIRTRVRSSMRAMAAQGDRFLGGRPPYGYRLVPAGPHPNPRKAAEGATLKRLEGDPDTAPIVTRIFSEYASGASLSAIARGLDADDIPCPAAADPERNPHRCGDRWQSSTVRAILANPRYLGQEVWGRAPRVERLLDPTDVAGGTVTVQQWAPEDAWVRSEAGKLPALVDQHTADAVHAKLQSGRSALSGHAPHAPTAENYSFRGLLICTGCGRRMHGVTRHGRHYYRCSSKSVNIPAGHPRSVYVREDQVMDRVDPWIAQVCALESQALADADLVAACNGESDLESRKQAVRRAMAEAERKITRLEKALDEGLPLSAFTRLVRKHEAEREAARTDLAKLSAPTGPLSPEELRAALASAQLVAQAIARATGAERCRLYQALGLELRYDPNQRQLTASLAIRAGIQVGGETAFSSGLNREDRRNGGDFHGVGGGT